MVTSGPLNITIGRITNFNRSNENKIKDTYIRVASQSKFSKPSDNITDYFRSEQSMSDKNGYKTVRQELRIGIEMIAIAEKAGTHIFEDLTRMKHLVDLYYDSSATDNEKTLIEEEFNLLKSLVNHTIENTKYNGEKVIQDTSSGDPILSINLDPNNINTTYDIDFNSTHVSAAADILSLDITTDQATALSDVQTELDKAGAYIGKVSGYRYGLNSQLNIAGKKIISHEEIKANLSNIDSGKEMAEMVKLSISRQSSMAMLSQANMEKKNMVLLLLNNNISYQ